MAVTISGTVNPVAGSSAYGDGSALQFTAAGTAGQLLQSNGASAPSWASSVAATAGGTGQTSYAVGDLLYASTTTALSKLADVATGNALISGGVGVAPSWGKIALTTHVSGTLPVANGGTGTTTPSLVAGTNITLSGTWPNQTINASGGGGGSGTVTSVDLTVPSFLSYFGGAITTSGTFNISLAQSPNNGELLIGTGGSGFSYATLTAGANVTITNGSGSITIASSGGGGGGITWSSNTSPGGSIPAITSPTGYGSSGNKVVVVVVGSNLFNYQVVVSSGAASFSAQPSGSNTVVYAADTGPSMGSTINISFSFGYSDFAMAYVYITSGNVTNQIGTTSTSTSSTSASLSQPSPNTLNPRMIGVSTSSSLNLATAASTASGGGPTWATGSGFAHPTYNQLSACVWVGTGTWNSFGATANITSNPSFVTWYTTGIASS